MGHREPVNSVYSECHTRHVKRSRVCENGERSSSHHQIYAREELGKAGHAKPPHPHRPIDFGASLGIAEKSLPTPDEVARSETEKADRDGPKRRTSKRKCLRLHCVEPPQLHVLYASAVPNSRARFATAASPLEPQSFKSLRRGHRAGIKERKCHGFDEEVSLPTFLCKNRKVTPFAQPEGRHCEVSRNHFHFPFVVQLRTSWTKLSAASSRPSEFNSELL